MTGSNHARYDFKASFLGTASRSFLWVIVLFIVLCIDVGTMWRQLPEPTLLIQGHSYRGSVHTGARPPCEMFVLPAGHKQKFKKI